MRRSLSVKLTLAFLGVAVIVALLVAVFIRLFSGDQLIRLIIEQQRSEFRSVLITYYQTHGSWDGVEEYLRQSRSPGLAPGTPEAGATPNAPAGDFHPAARHDRRELFGVADADGSIVVSLFAGYPLGMRVAPEVLAEGESIEVDGRVVGTILTAAIPPGLNPEEAAYLRRTNVALAVAGAGAVLAALLMGGLLARTLTRPLHALTEATQRMAGGELEQEVPVTSADEIGNLTTAFNRMSREVARAHKVRRQMTADVAHELRTPLTVIAGYIESMRDGVLSPTPERLTVIYTEIERLQALVSELQTLTLVDAGELKLNRQPIAPGELLHQAFATFEHPARRKAVQLAVHVDPDLPAILVDESRMAQVLDNLISNALRYTPAGGRITLGAARQGDRLKLTVEDTGAGIAAGDLPFVFDRFYRADQSRAADDGESGLGLAIVKAVVEAHEGEISVASAPGQGTTFIISLPASPGTHTAASRI